MLTKEEIDKIWTDNDQRHSNMSDIPKLIAHIREQEAELIRRVTECENVLKANISLRETVRFLNDHVRVQDAALATRVESPRPR
jgi:hypothetical protein